MPVVIADDMLAEFGRHHSSSAIERGFTRCDGILLKFATSDIGMVMPSSPQFPTLGTLLCLNATGMTIHFAVQTANLEPT
jgi:hypothetical protein